MQQTPDYTSVLCTRSQTPNHITTLCTRLSGTGAIPKSGRLNCRRFDFHPNYSKPKRGEVCLEAITLNLNSLEENFKYNEGKGFKNDCRKKLLETLPWYHLWWGGFEGGVLLMGLSEDDTCPV
ncbi:hypothetical protein CEXT_470311 [Caerostris extrusa]|uniref:LAGLIDADG homing endonuclease n=1 Tax=Caerostris extrusa TaxID=172846 RepID=A0AAV4QI42_CAEEX|nr:hypothetical protein CEXT_470311 [Caerostris extrusa]